MEVLTKPITGDKLDEFRKSMKVEMLTRNMSYAQLARRTGFSVKTIYNNMCSNKISKFLASAIAEELCIDISDYEKEIDDGRTEE